jgi:hypothetical protein
VLYAVSVHVDATMRCKIKLDRGGVPLLAFLLEVCWFHTVLNFCSPAPLLLASFAQHDLQVVCANLLEGPEHASCLRCKCIAQDTCKPQLQVQREEGWEREGRGSTSEVIDSSGLQRPGLG